MTARTANPATAVPGALPALLALARATEVDGLPESTRYLVHLRVSQLNGCAVCVQLHAEDLLKAGESTERVVAVAAWRDSPHFDAAERAALALSEAATRMADRPDPVPDDVWADAARHFAEPALGALVLTIALINTWNRLNVTTRQVAGTPWA